MKALFIAVAVGLVIGIVRLCLFMKIFHADAYGKTFVCPSCGARFNVKWYQLMYKVFSVRAFSAAYLKCPVCQKKDRCTVAHDER